MKPRAAFKVLAKGKQKAGYSLLLSPFLRSISLPVVAPDSGPLCHAALHRSFLSMVASLGSPVSCPWGRSCGRGFAWCARKRRCVRVSSECPFGVKWSARPLGCCASVSYPYVGEARVNLATPLCVRPSSEADMPLPCPSSVIEICPRPVTTCDAVVTGLASGLPKIRLRHSRNRAGGPLPHPPVLRLGPEAAQRSNGGQPAPKPRQGELTERPCLFPSGGAPFGCGPSSSSI